jgi:hypothetical protein
MPFELWVGTASPADKPGKNDDGQRLLPPKVHEPSARRRMQIQWRPTCQQRFISAIGAVLRIL